MNKPSKIVYHFYFNCAGIIFVGTDDELDTYLERFSWRHDLKEEDIEKFDYDGDGLEVSIASEPYTIAPPTKNGQLSTDPDIREDWNLIERLHRSKK
jgi:hypothetical protein